MQDLLTFAQSWWGIAALAAAGGLWALWPSLSKAVAAGSTGLGGLLKTSTAKPDRKAAVDALMVAHDFCEGCIEGQAAIQAAISHVLKHHPAEGRA